jgi:hypothetical protein
MTKLSGWLRHCGVLVMQFSDYHLIMSKDSALTLALQISTAITLNQYEMSLLDLFSSTDR